MASKLAHITTTTRRRPTSLLRLFGCANATSSPSRQSSNFNALTLFHSSTRSLSTTQNSSGGPDADISLSRRRRRRGGPVSSAAGVTGQQSNNPGGGDFTTNTTAGGVAAFTPKDASGNLLDAPQYLALASLSPWVPCPDMVIKRVLEIAEASELDVHADLGCGDGRLNFAAVGGPYHVRSSWGVDVDPNILERCRERIGRRFVPSGFGGDDVGGGDGGGSDGASSSEADKLEFLQADLIPVMERQKEKHQLRLQQQPPLSSSVQDEDASSQDCSQGDDITQKLSESTVITMYFVDDALKQVQPYLSSVLGGREDVRVITVGYEMKGWSATWVERVLGLTIFKYDMRNISNDPSEWRVGGDQQQGEETTMDNAIDLDADIDEDAGGAVAEYLQRKREQDIKELNEGLRIHHDEALDDFAQSRAKEQRPTLVEAGTGEIGEQEENDWDFDENEDPAVLMREAHKIMAEQRMGGRGKGLMAGLGDKDKPQKKCKGGTKKKKKKPIWKKP